MILRAGLMAIALVTAAAAQQELVGRWVGVADSTDEAGTRRQERQGFDIRSEEGGKLTATSIPRNGKPGAPLQIQVYEGKINLYRLLDFEGGEHLRWKVELKEGGKLIGTFSALHDNPKKWIYDRIGALTMTKTGAAAETAGTTK